MNEANWAKIGHFLGPLFLGNESNVGGVETMKVTCVEIGEFFMTAMMSTLMVSQQVLKKAPEKPSGPGALSLAVLLTVALTPSSVNGSLRPARSHCGVGIVIQLKFLVRGRPLSPSKYMVCRVNSPILIHYEMCSIDHYYHWYFHF
jgi:hypothetical protein